ncbi:acyl-CoA dehydrogenase family protein [Sediminivirga luteola]|uniref:acyl-CoA dehydrogenase family protein n=1 Tax=Sediminivirga luteola TaxID=1774748 RepID=UPI001F55EEC4|nr:hypothetical protein [Sediminivirga luteola]MCI2264489.1 hypothetical protein [Sediminivirga luteola]
MTSVDDTRKALSGLISQLREGAVERERGRLLPDQAVRDLLRAGIGALRVPAEHGGQQQNVHQLIETLIQLAAADSNLTQIIRGHLGFVELLLLWRRTSATTAFLEAAGRGEFFGPAASEKARRGEGVTELLQLHTVLEETDGGLYLNGEKFYTTGSIFADWLNVLVRYGDTYAEVVVPRSSPGIEITDDWNGFGQRLTASGTARFTGVPVERDHVLVHDDADAFTYVQAFYQLVHSATQAGIAQRVAEDLGEAVRHRNRKYPLAPGGAEPREDPQVLHTVGAVGAEAFSLRATTLAAAEALDDYLLARQGPGADSDATSRALSHAAAASAAAQVVNGARLPALTWNFFEATSASALDADKAFDRHWRNARTVSSHNPSVYKARAIGDFLVNQRPPGQPR